MMRKKTVCLVAVLAIIAWASGYSCWKLWIGDVAFRIGNRLYYEEHDYQAALEKYKQVQPASAHYATAQRYIGHNIYGREWGQWNQGVPYLEEALRAHPSDPKVLEDIGRAYVNVGRIDEGIGFLQKANTDVAQAALASRDEPAWRNP